MMVELVVYCETLEDYTTRLHGITPQETLIFTVTVVGFLNAFFNSSFFKKDMHHDVSRFGN
jgi:hypothetical protein